MPRRPAARPTKSKTYVVFADQEPAVRQLADLRGLDSDSRLIREWLDECIRRERERLRLVLREEVPA